jgi:hypothetical protein
VKAELDNKVIGKGTTFEKKCRQHRQRHPQQCVTIRVRKTLRSERSPPLATTAADLAPQGQSRFFATLRFQPTVESKVIRVDPPKSDCPVPAANCRIAALARLMSVYDVTDAQPGFR